MRFAIPLLALVSGCISGQRTWDYSFGRIVYASETEVNYQCCQKVQHLDDGTFFANPKRCDGCYDPVSRTAWVAWGAEEPATVLHEICHMDGNKNGNCQ